MQNVVINGKKFGVNCDSPVKLNNGGLVLHYNKLGDVLGAYIVTSYRDQKGICEHRGENTHGYCSLINLDNGYIKFDERCSRTTTVGRVLAHLVPDGDFGGKRACEEGQYIEVYNVGNYKINLEFKKDDKQ